MISIRIQFKIREFSNKIPKSSSIFTLIYANPHQSFSSTKQFAAFNLKKPHIVSADMENPQEITKKESLSTLIDLDDSLVPNKST